MKRYLTITIDVEPDCSPNWLYSSPLRFDGVQEGIENRLQPLFNRYNMSPTYLINNVVLEDDKSCQTLANLKGRFELGTHLHPEFIEPQKTEFEYAGKKGRANCCFYPPDVEFAKLSNITELFRSRFGRQPVSFRAGRFSAGGNTISSLARLNYKVDTSVTPHVVWRDKTREAPVDFRRAPQQPYFMQHGSILQEDPAGAILQVPVTISLRRANIVRELKSSLFGMRRPIEKFRPLWLRPKFSWFKDFISLVDEYTLKYRDNKIIVFNMMFHNVEVMPALSPYTLTEQDCRYYLSQLEIFFDYCNRNDIEGVTLAETYPLYRPTAIVPVVENVQ